MRALREIEGFDFDIAPTPEEAAALARLLGAQAVRKLRFAGSLSPLDGGGWGLDATLGASVVQTCVVTLEPVTTRIDQTVRRRFLPMPGLRAAELVIDPEEDEEIEPLGDRIDLGLVAIEALALALPAYPRKEGAVLGRRRRRCARRRRGAEALRGSRRAARKTGRRLVKIAAEALARRRAIGMFRASFPRTDRRASCA